MREKRNINDFLDDNKTAFLKATKGKRLNLPRSKPRNRKEFLAIGKIVVETIRKAEEEGNFIYEPGKGLKIKWKV